jgi:hypothetical protein
MLVFQVVTRVDLQVDTNVLEKHTASIFRAEVYMVFQPRRPTTTSLPLREPQISYNHSIVSTTTRYQHQKFILKEALPSLCTC